MDPAFTFMAACAFGLGTAWCHDINAVVVPSTGPLGGRKPKVRRWVGEWDAL